MSGLVTCSSVGVRGRRWLWKILDPLAKVVITRRVLQQSTLLIGAKCCDQSLGCLDSRLLERMRCEPSIDNRRLELSLLDQNLKQRGNSLRIDSYAQNVLHRFRIGAERYVDC